MNKGKILRENIIPIISIFLAIVLMWAGVFVVKPFMEEKERENENMLDMRKQIAERGATELVQTTSGKIIEMNATEKERFESRGPAVVTSTGRRNSASNGNKRKKNSKNNIEETGLILKPSSKKYVEFRREGENKANVLNPFKPWFEEIQTAEKTQEEITIEYKGYMERQGKRFAVIEYSDALHRLTRDDFVPETSYLIREIEKDSILVGDIKTGAQKRILLSGTKISTVGKSE